MKSFSRSSSLSLMRRANIDTDRVGQDLFFFRFLRLAVLHFVLGFLLYAFRPGLPTLFAFGITLAGLYVIAGKDPRALSYILIYITGVEIILRMTKADVFWEYGKYLSVGLILIAILRWRLRLSGLTLFYFALLTPSIFLTFNWFSASLARGAISFSLSGPLTLAFCTIYFQNIKLDRSLATRLLLVGVLPILTVSALTIRGILTSEQITFTLNSNFATSGGFGPNQVSAILGLGAMFCILYLFISRPSGFAWVFVFGLTVLFVVQSALTFSRGGLFNLVVALPIAAIFFMRQGARSQKQVIWFLFAFLAIAFVFADNLNAFTDGTLIERFQDTDTTGRAGLFAQDVQVWSQNPWLGVGVGVSPVFHLLLGGSQVSTHTEYSRILAEHGILGILSLLILVVIFIRAFIQSRSNQARGFLISMIFWSLAEMAHAAMRIVAISTVFALPLATLDWDEPEARESIP
jgi:O-antigen ligase